MRLRPTTLELLALAQGGEPPSAVEGLVRALSAQRLSMLALETFPREDEWPAGDWDRLREERRQLAALYALRRAAMEELVALPAARGIRIAALKGFAYAHTLYAYPELRPFNDLDLLVEPAAWERLSEALAAQGWERVRESADPGESERIRRRGPVVFDLHRSLFRRPPYRFDTEAVLARALPLPGWPGLLQLDPLDALLFHAAHHAKHCLALPLVAWVDFLRLGEAATAAAGVETEALLEARARGAGALRALRLVLAAASELALPLPPVLLDAPRLRPTLAERRLARALVRPARPPVIGRPLLREALFRLAVVDDPRDALASLPVGARFALRRAAALLRRARPAGG